MVLIHKLWAMLQSNTALHLTALPGRFYQPEAFEASPDLFILLSARPQVNASRWAACGVGTDFCVGAIRQSTRLFGASGRHSGRTTPCLIGKPIHRNLNRAFPYHSALIRGTQSGAAQHRVAPDSLAAAILPTRSSLRQIPIYSFCFLQGRR